MYIDQFFFVWGQDKCTPIPVEEKDARPILSKPLTTVFDEYPQYNTSNTTIIDDSPQKMEGNDLDCVIFVTDDDTIDNFKFVTDQVF